MQVKSAATVAILADYADRFVSGEIYDRLFFICHSPSGALRVPVGKNTHLWLLDDIADQAVRAGLLGWLINRVR